MINLTRFLSIATAMIGVVAIVPTAAFAQTGQDHEQHHPQGTTENGEQVGLAPAEKGAATPRRKKVA